MKIQSKDDYHFIQLQNLEPGQYQLTLKHCYDDDNDHRMPSSDGSRKFQITVHKGSYWENNFILSNNKFVESSIRKKPLIIQNTRLICNE